jgi:hypothetical protein
MLDTLEAGVFMLASQLGLLATDETAPTAASFN